MKPPQLPQLTWFWLMKHKIDDKRFRRSQAIVRRARSIVGRRITWIVFGGTLAIQYEDALRALEKALHTDGLEQLEIADVKELINAFRDTITDTISEGERNAADRNLTPNQRRCARIIVAARSNELRQIRTMYRQFGFDEKEL
jgi:DNA replication initiation complex subunit (GINS family)